MVRVFVEISKIMSERMQFKIMNPRRNSTRWSGRSGQPSGKLKQQKVFTLIFSGVCYNNIIKQAYQIQERESDERSKRHMAVF